MDTPSERLIFKCEITADGETAVEALARVSGLPKQRIKSAMQKGAAWLTRGRNTQRLRRAKRELKAGDRVDLYYDPDILAEVPPTPALVADRGEYSVWNKPYGLRSQGSKWGDHCTVLRWAEQNLNPERPGFTVHRLDRAANGLILIAHTKSTAAALSALFRGRKIDKRYRAVVHGDFSTQATPLRLTTPIDGKAASSEISHRQFDGTTSIVDVRIETGRKHQIRRHLADHGFPIVGDRLYGTGEQDGVDLQLTAYSLAFDCPVEGRPVEFVLPLNLGR